MSDLGDTKDFIKVVYKESFFYFPIVKSSKPVDIKRLLIPYVNHKIRDMKLVVEDLDGFVELKNRLESNLTIYLLLRDPETQKFEKITDVREKK